MYTYLVSTHVTVYFEMNWLSSSLHAESDETNTPGKAQQPESQVYVVDKLYNHIYWRGMS